MVEGLIGLLADGLIHLHLQNQVRAALQVEPELDAPGKIVAQLRQRGGQGRQTEQAINAEQNHQGDKNNLPFKIGVHEFSSVFHRAYWLQ